MAMVRRAVKPRRRFASCCRLLVMKGAGGKALASRTAVAEKIGGAILIGLAAVMLARGL